MKTEQNRPLFSFVELLLLLVIIFAILFPYSPISHGLPSRDSGVFLYGGWRVLKGDIPYLQFWDHKPPVIYYIDALGLWLAPDSLWGVWSLEFVSLGLATLAGYALLKQLYGVNTAIISTFLWLFSSFTLLAGGNLTNEYGLPFQFLLMWLFQRAEKKGNYKWVGYFIGACSGLLFFTRQNAIGIPIAIGIYLLANRLYQREFQRLVRDLLPILAGAITVFVIIVGYFTIKGAWQAFWDTAFQYNFLYADERDTTDRIYAVIQGMNQLANVGLAQLGFLGWAGALVLLVYKKERIQSSNYPLFWMAVLALPLELWMVSIGGRPRIPYFLSLLPIFSLFAGFSIWLFFDSISNGLPVHIGAILVVFLTLVLGIVFFADFSELTGNFLQWSGDPAIISYIRKNSGPQDYVLMWGEETTYNFAARRASPSRFVYQTPLYNVSNRDNVLEFLRDIQSKKPRLIILRSNDKLSDFRFAFRDNQVGGMMDQVKSMYQGPIAIEDWLIYTYPK